MLTICNKQPLSGAENEAKDHIQKILKGMSRPGDLNIPLLVYETREGL
jgi:hypothetical protein